MHNVWKRRWLPFSYMRRHTGLGGTPRTISVIAGSHVRVVGGKKEETLGTCDICEDFVSVKCVAKAWLGAARHIRCKNDKYLTVVYRYTDLPYDIMENIMGYALGHQNTLHSSWYPNGHYRDRRCGFGCRCCISLNTNRMGCSECKTYVRVKRVSFRLCLLSEYRSIKMKGRRH